MQKAIEELESKRKTGGRELLSSEAAAVCVYAESQVCPSFLWVITLI